MNSLVIIVGFIEVNGVLTITLIYLGIIALCMIVVRILAIVFYGIIDPIIFHCWPLVRFDLNWVQLWILLLGWLQTLSVGRLFFCSWSRFSSIFFSIILHGWSQDLITLVLIVSWLNRYQRFWFLIFSVFCGWICFLIRVILFRNCVILICQVSSKVTTIVILLIIPFCWTSLKGTFVSRFDTRGWFWW